jgi:hypothetical protein
MTPLVMGVVVAGAFIYSCYYDYKNPPKPIQYVWRNIYPDYVNDWNRGRCTLVYINPLNNSIRGKVIKTDEGLYLATMWNGMTKECLYEVDATESVENYTPRVYK